MTRDLWQRLKPLLHSTANRDARDPGSSTTEAHSAGIGRKNGLQNPEVAEGQNAETLDRMSGDSADFRPLQQVLFGNGTVILNRFRIVCLIGRGGMGEVYEAVDLELGKIALKTIRQGIGPSTEIFDRFRREVQLARKVSGSQICRIHELFLLPASDGHPATPFLTMEYLDGVTLSKKLRRDGPLPWKKALPIALDICEGLRLIHEKGIIHRDLKTANIMLCEQGDSVRVVLMDFGLARDFQPIDGAGENTPSIDQRNNTSHGMIAGTPGYMAPEQFEGKPVSPATDIYALGIVLYELVTGLHPFAAHSPLEAAIRRAKHPDPASSICRHLPKYWDRVIERCLQYEPEHRFASARDVAKAINPGRANIKNLRKDRPWIVRAVLTSLIAIILWGMYSKWQTRQYYRPSAQSLRWYDSGLAALREGTYVKATRSLQQAVSDDPHFAMAHVRLAEAWIDLDFEADAQQELLVATAEERRLIPLDRMYLDAVRATISRDFGGAVRGYTKILGRLPPQEQAAGYVDLGMAYDRSGDPNHALESYEKAAQLDDQGPAPYMHTAVLQSRLHHVAEADQAFLHAEKLFRAESNQEGLAELDFQRGYSYNDRSDPADAERLLQRSLDEAVALGSVQLEIRAHTQLSSAAYSSGHYEQAVDHAQQAIRLARGNRLDSWAADGLVRLASARIMEDRLPEAEDAVQEGLQLAHSSGQLRAQALANITLASLMDQKGQPDQVIAPAQAALDYYKSHGFFMPAANASLLLVRAQTDKGEYSSALKSGKESVEVASASGVPQLKTLSEENVGYVYREMENYPEALLHFQNARSSANNTSTKASENLHCADVLWRLGRYAESDAVLQTMPEGSVFAARVSQIHLDSLISRGKYAAALSLANEALAASSSVDAGDKQALELGKSVAEAHLDMKAEALKHLDEATAHATVGNPADVWRTKLRVAEIELYSGRTQQAQHDAAAATDYFMSTGQLDSELRDLCLMASASKKLGDFPNYAASSKKAVDIMAQLQQNWGLEAYQTYLSRPDQKVLVREIDLAPPLDRR
jgi:serine/threonine protein kinase